MAEMQPGAKLDRWVAERVLGWRLVPLHQTPLAHCLSGGTHAWVDAEGATMGCARCDEYPRGYSQDMTAMADAAEEARAAGKIRAWDLFCGQDCPDDGEISFSAGTWRFDGQDYVRTGRSGVSPAHALALALLAAVE